MNSTNINLFETKTYLYSTASPCQTLYEQHTRPNIGPSATLPSSSITVNPINPPHPVTTQNHSAHFVTMNKPMKIFDGLDYQYTPEENLRHFGAHKIFTLREQPLDRVVYNQWHK